MKRAAFTFLCATLFCTSGVSAAEEQTKLPWERHTQVSQQTEALTQVQCAERGGEWAARGAAKKESCALKTTDGGKIFKSSSECEIACVARVDPRYSKNRFVVAECVKSTTTFGCIFYVEDGAVVHGDCRE